MGAVAFVLKGYPRLSETFIAQEIRALEQRGLDIRIVSLRRPTDKHTHPIHAEIAAPVLYLPEYLYQEPGRVWRGWRHARRLPGYRAAFRTWLSDLFRDPTPNRVRRFGQAMVLARELPEGVDRLHAHFLHTPASVTRYAAKMLGVEWTCSAHAKDIWTSPDWEKREKLADCRWLVTCSDAARTHLAALAPDADRVELVYHGLDLARFAPPENTGAAAALRNEGKVRILCVGRAVEKKGLDVLLRALAALPRESEWQLIHIGGGPMLRQLKHLAEVLDIDHRIEWRGALPQKDVLAQYRAADLFVLASQIARDGDRDGLPNVLLEAQSQGVPCIASAVSAVPELIVDGKTGVLVPPADPAALAAAIGELIARPDRRMFLGRAGMNRVRGHFGSGASNDRLAEKFGLTPDATRGNTPDPSCALRSTHP